MKRAILVAATIFSISLSFGQSIPGFNRNDTMTIPCPYDNTTETLVFEEWEAYQTIDGRWNGIIDSTSCFDFAIEESNRSNATIYFSDIDASKPVYIRAKLGENNKVPLFHNSLYDFQSHFWASDDFLLNTNNNCLDPDSVCSGIFVGIQVPDSLGSGTNIRWNTVSAGDNFVSDFSMCLISERFVSGNFLLELIYKFEYAGNGGADSLHIFSPYLNDLTYNTQIYTSLEVPEVNGAYNYYFQDYYMSNHLFLYSDSTYPNEYNISYAEITPVPNPSIRDTINLLVGYYSSIMLQPYTSLRGALVNGDTSNRHIVNIVNNGGNFCFPPIIEKGFENGDQYIHNAGKVEFGGQNSCMMFGKESKLVVGESATLDYATPSKGILALYTGSTIELKPGAEFIMHGKMIIDEYAYETEPQQIYIDLPEGTTFTFAEGSSLSNRLSINQLMKLNFYMNGGVLDDSGLSTKDKRLINRIYDEPDNNAEDNAIIYENPISEQLKFSYIAEEDQEIYYQIITLSGQSEYSTSASAKKGINYFKIDTKVLSTGIYFLKILVGDKSVVKKIVKQ